MEKDAEVVRRAEEELIAARQGEEDIWGRRRHEDDIVWSIDRWGLAIRRIFGCVGGAVLELLLRKRSRRSVKCRDVF